MIGLVLLVLILGFLVVAALYLVSSLIGLVLMLFVAGLIGFIADYAVPGRLPFGWLGAILAGLVGMWLGQLIFRAVGVHNFGPSIFDIYVVPALLGAIILAFLANLVAKRSAGRSYT